MDAAGTEPALRDLKTPALTQQNMAGGNADVFKQPLGVAGRGIVGTEYEEHLLDLDALGIERHQDLRLLLMARQGRVGLAPHAGNLAAGIADARRPPFAAVDD